MVLIPFLIKRHAAFPHWRSVKTEDRILEGHKHLNDARVPLVHFRDGSVHVSASDQLHNEATPCFGQNRSVTGGEFCAFKPWKPVRIYTMALTGVPSVCSLGEI